MNDNDGAKLRCPKCGSTDRFTIAATVWVKVSGDDYLEVIDEDGDREYGSEDACKCGECGHGDTLGAFYLED